MFKYFYILLLGILCSFTIFAKKDLSLTIQRAENFYDKGKYQEAASLYEELIKDNKVSGAVYYNLGNSYFRLGEKGKAMAAYLAAREISPRDPDLKHNLSFVQSKIEDKVDLDNDGALTTVLTLWTHLITTEELQVIGLLFFCLGMTLLLLRSFVSLPEFLYQVQLSFLGLAFVLGFFWKSSLYLQKNWAAVSVAEASIHSGPGEINTTLFKLHDGAPVVVEEIRPDWYKISFSEDKVGWVKASYITHFAL